MSRPLRIAIAPDSFKESLPATEVCSGFATGWQTIRPKDEFVFLPLADGGEGTTVAITNARDGIIKHKLVTGPMGEPVNGFIGLWNNNQHAVIEIASASGLHLVPRQSRNPELATSYGTGELIRFALDQGARQLVVGLGGSATNDGGAGILQALGAKLLDVDNTEIESGSIHLRRLKRLDLSELDPRLKECSIRVASDVNNPLLGDQGASAIFGPQKGASAEQVQKLDQILAHYADVLEQTVTKKVRDLPGSGAAGGAGVALLGVLDAEFHPGIALVMEQLHFAEQIRDCDLVITGEGQMDHQSLMGKAPQGVLQQCLKQNKPVIAIAGSLGEGTDQLLEAGFKALFPIVSGVCTLEQALQNSRDNLQRTAAQLARLVNLSDELLVSNK